MTDRLVPVLLEFSPAAGWPEPSTELRAAEERAAGAARTYQEAGSPGAAGYTAAAIEFLAAAAALKAADGSNHRESALRNRKVAYYNAGYAWQAAGDPAAGRNGLSSIDDPECDDVLAEVISELNASTLKT